MKISKSVITILVATSYVMYIFSVYQAYHLCLENRQVDPLITIHALFPFYYIAICLWALICLLLYFLNFRSKYVHIVFLVQFALMLWFTPYYLAGFVREPDGIWHVGVSCSIPEVIQGEHVDFSEYALSYPGSFIFNYLMLEITGVNPKNYIGLVYPSLLTFLIIFLWYTYIYRFFDQKTAFLGTLIAIPGLHYIKLHPSPQTFGFVLLLLSAIFLLTQRKRNALVLGLMGLFSLITVHPESPVVLILFLMATLIANHTLKNAEKRKTGIVLMISYLAWFYWHFFWSTGTGYYITKRVYDILTLQFGKGLEITQEYAIGTPFIYPEIYIMNRLVYFLYLFIVALCICQVFFANLILKRNIKVALTCTFKKLGYNGTTMTLLLLWLLAFTFGMALFGSPVLIERGLSILILVASLIIASRISLIFRSGGYCEIRTTKSIKKISRCAAFSLTIFVVAMTLMYPILSYSMDAYLNYPPSEDFGLEFLSAKIPSFNGKKIAMSFPEQLALYKTNLGIFETINLHFSKPADLNKTRPDVFVFRSTGYYYAAMRLDISFEQNRFYNYSAFLVNGYNKVYSNPAFEIWIKP